MLQEQDLDLPLEVDPARSAVVIEHLSAKRSQCARVVIGEQALGLFSNAPLDALTSATSPASCRIPLASTRLRSLVRRLLTDDNPCAQEALRAEMLYDDSGASRIDLERLI